MPDSVILNVDANLQMGWFRYNRFLISGIRPALDVGILSITVMALFAWVTGVYLGGADLRSRLKWSSSSLFAPGSLILFVGLTLTSAPVVSAISINMVSSRYDEAYRQALIGVITQVFQQIGVGFVVTGGVACLIAFGLLI